MPTSADDFVARGGGGVRAVPRADRQVLVRRAVAGVGGGRRHRRGRLHPHQPPDAAGARHRRAVPPDDRARHHHDRRHPGPAPHRRARRCCCARRRFAPSPNRACSAATTARSSDGTLRVRFGEVEARGVALTPKGRERYDAAMARTGTPPRCGASTSRRPTRRWPRRDWPTTAAATHPNPSSTKTSCQPRRLASSAPTWTATPRPGRTDAADDSGYNVDWMAGAIGRDIHDPYALYESLSQEALCQDMTTPVPDRR